MASGQDVSLLFDFFVASQRLRRVLAAGLEESGMRPDEYAVYSSLFEAGPMTASQMAEDLGMPLTTVLEYLRAMDAAGHLVRTAHPFDGRAIDVNLNRAGVAAHRRANRHWEVVRRRIEHGLAVPLPQVRRSLQALAAAAEAASLSGPARQRRPHVLQHASGARPRG
jgi:DNA-binding MarR family transcriptional regulator